MVSVHIKHGFHNKPWLYCEVVNMLQLKEVQSTLHDECILCTVHVHKSHEYAE